MATRRKRVKHSHNKTRNTTKTLLRKTTYKNKNKTHRIKNHRTKKIYQSGGGPKAPKTPKTPKTPKQPKSRARGASGEKVELKVSRAFQRRGEGFADMPERHMVYKKQNPTAEFDIPLDISGLPFNVSVKSVKRKTPGQKAYTIMCGDARRFLTEIGLGRVPYHMIIGIRQQHPTNPHKKKVVGCEIDLREYKSILFGRASDREIKDIIDESHRLTELYYQDSTKAKPLIDSFNKGLKTINSKLQLAPKKENVEKGRGARVQATFNIIPQDPINKPFLKDFELSSIENSPEDEDNGTGAGVAAMAVGQAAQEAQEAQSLAPISPRLAPVKTSRRGITKKRVEPRPPTEYFRSFKPRERKSIQLTEVLEEPSRMSQPPRQPTPFSPAVAVAGPALAGPVFSAIPSLGHSSQIPPVVDEFWPPIDTGRRFPTSPAFSPVIEDE